MTSRAEWARLLPDFRTLYIAFAELDRFKAGGTKADAFLTAMTYATRLFEPGSEAHARVRQIMEEAGLPEDDLLGQELCCALVARAAFLRDHADT